jgi:tetratricopeptide (TPR) repeat protein
MTNDDPRQATLDEVAGAARAGDFATAAARAQAALDGGFEHPLFYNVLALSLEQGGRVEEAARLLERGVRLAPGDVGVRNALGLVLLRLDRPAEALPHFQALIAAHPELAFAHTSAGNALLALGALSAAESGFRRALELDPGQVAATAGLAHVAARRGRHADARRLAEQALAAAPGFPDAVRSLASADLGERAPGAAELRLRAQLADPALPALDRAWAQGLLGDALDAQGRPAEAFEQYSACNAALRRLHAARYAGEQDALAYARALDAFFETAPAADWKRPAPPPGPDRPVFLTGFPRSGTTLLEVALEGSPAVAALEENESLFDGVQAFMRRPGDVARLASAPDSELEPLREKYWQRVVEAGGRPAGRQFVDKHPLNTLKLPLIARLFPGARIVYALRDPRDVVLSCFRHRFRLSAPTYTFLTLEGAAQYYDAVMRVGTRLAALLPLHVHFVRYERLVVDFDGEMRALCAFLGIEYLPAMRDFGPRTRERSRATPSTAQLARGLYDRGVGQWRAYARELAPVMPVLEPWVKGLRYDAD